MTMEESHEARGREPAGDDWIDWQSALGRRKWLIGAVVVATVLTAYVAVRFVMPEVYETKASILVKVGRENVEVPATVQKGGFVSSGVRREELNSEVQLISSPALITAAVDRLGLDAFRREPAAPGHGWRVVLDYIRAGMRAALGGVDAMLIKAGLKKQLTDREKVIVTIQRALRADVELESQVISLKLRFGDRDLAVRLLDSLVQLYLDRHLEVWRDGDARGFFDDQAATRRKQVAELEAAREAVKARWNLVAVAEQRSLILRQLDGVKGEIAAGAARKAAALAQEQAMRARLEALPEQLRQTESIAPSPVARFRRERLAMLEQERARRLSVYAPGSPPMQYIDREIASLTELLTRESPTEGSLTYQANPLRASFTQSIEQIRVDIAGLESSRRQLEARAVSLEERLQEINTGERQLRDLDRQYQMAEESYLGYAKRVEEGRISDELDRRRVANVSLLSPPVASIEPVAPRKLLIMVLSLPVGLLLGVALALFAEYLGQAVSTPRDLAGIEGVAYLGTVRL
jgi:uncharacterized protein involved in exopolysaccharide biosynthesis